jgi:hypothetical protein
VKRRVTAVRVLLRIERHLRRVLRHQQSADGGGLTVGGAARRAGVSETTIRRAIRAADDRDRLPAFDIALEAGKPAWRIRPADLDARLKRREGGPTPPPARPTTRAAGGPSRHFKF